VRRRASRQLGRPMVADDPGLRVRLVDLAQAPLTPLGRVWLRSELIRRQVSQARLEDEFRRRPGLLNTPLWRPLVIVGLPRTGTTLLHSLLGVTRRRWCCRSGGYAGPTRSLGEGWTGRPGSCGQRPWPGWPGQWRHGWGTSIPSRPCAQRKTSSCSVTAACWLCRSPPPATWPGCRRPTRPRATRPTVDTCRRWWRIGPGGGRWWSPPSTWAVWRRCWPRSRRRRWCGPPRSRRRVGQLVQPGRGAWQRRR
jgi:hypothetical protein